jgi:hypothetical protein
LLLKTDFKSGILFSDLEIATSGRMAAAEKPKSGRYASPLLAMTEKRVQHAAPLRGAIS